MDSASLREFIKALAASGALALLIVYGMQLRHDLRARRWVSAVALALIAAVAVAGYFEFGWKRYGTYMNSHDFYHYYTGTKYAPELGYFNQYAASLLADQEGGKLFDTRQSIRNLETHGYTSSAAVLAQKEAIKGQFTPERWEEFKRDIGYFQNRVPKAKWQQMLRDKGYNGTPVWSMMTGLLTNGVGTDNDAGMWLLTAADPIILGLMFLAIWWAFGPWCALFALVFFGTNFVASFVHIKGGLIRMDWVACLVISMCLLRKQHYKTAGAVLAYAAAARVFPAVFAFGVGALAFWDLLATRRINRDYVGFFGAFGVTVAALLGASYLYYGPALWQEFIAKIGVHNADISTTRVGFKYVFLWPFETFDAKVAGFEAHQRLWWTIQLVMLALSFAAARNMKPWQALGLGFVPAYFLTAPTFYYYVLLIVPLLVFLPELHKGRNVLGASLFFASSIVGYGLHYGWNLGFQLSFFLSCMYGVIAAYLLAVNLVPARLAAAAQRFPRALGAFRAPLLGLAYVSFIVGLFLTFRADRSPDPAPPRAEAPGVASEPTRAATAPDVQPAPARPPRPEATQALGGGTSITLALVGDIMLARNVARDLESRGLDFTYPFAVVAPLLQTADIAFANLECPISGRGEPIDKKYLFNAVPESVQGLVSGGLDVVSLANNHTLDYGPLALEDTERILEENQIAGVGIADGDGPQVPAILERKGIRVGFLAYADPETPYAYAKEFLPFERGPARAVKASIARDIAALSEAADVIVVSMHWGIEYEEVPNERQIDLGQFCIDQGAHIVAGHHPHVQQDAAWYKDGLIIYSMGNFVFDQWTRPKTMESRLYSVTVTKTGPVHAQYRPLEIVRKDWQPRPTGPNYVAVLRGAE